MNNYFPVTESQVFVDEVEDYADEYLDGELDESLAGNANEHCIDWGYNRVLNGR
jgi:hypothetical protein